MHRGFSHSDTNIGGVDPLFFHTPMSSADTSSMFSREFRSTTNDTPFEMEVGTFEQMKFDDLRDGWSNSRAISSTE